MAADHRINRFEVLLIGVVLGALAVGVPGYLWHNQRIEEERRLAEEAKARLLEQEARQNTLENLRKLALSLPNFAPGIPFKGEAGKDDKAKGFDFDMLRPFLEQALKQDQPKK